LNFDQTKDIKSASNNKIINFESKFGEKNKIGQIMDSFWFYW